MNVLRVLKLITSVYLGRGESWFYQMETNLIKLIDQHLASSLSLSLPLSLSLSLSLSLISLNI